MSTRKIVDIERNGEKVYPKAHAKATYLSDGRNVEDAINAVGSGGGSGEGSGEMNVQSDWNVTDTSSDAFIKNKPTIPAEVTSTTVANWGYTKNAGTITGIKMNGVSKGTSGVVDLGTIITAHQDISGKADKSDLNSVSSRVKAIEDSSSTASGGDLVDIAVTTEGGKVTSVQVVEDGIENALAKKANATDVDLALAAKQAKLVSGTNIKTINGNSILGSGDITISGSGDMDLSEYAKVDDAVFVNYDILREDSAMDIGFLNAKGEMLANGGMLRLPSANEDEAGLMSAEDKVKLNEYMPTLKLNLNNLNEETPAEVITYIHATLLSYFDTNNVVIVDWVDSLMYPMVFYADANWARIDILDPEDSYQTIQQFGFEKDGTFTRETISIAPGGGGEPSRNEVITATDYYVVATLEWGKHYGVHYADDDGIKSLDISFGDNSEGYGETSVEFDCVSDGFELTMPANTQWANNTIPEFKVYYHYQISVTSFYNESLGQTNYYAICVGFPMGA